MVVSVYLKLMFIPNPIIMQNNAEKQLAKVTRDEEKKSKPCLKTLQRGQRP